MFCVNCGNKLEEEWKVCPECGTEVIKQKEEKKIEILEKRVCEKCGNELQNDWVKCPFCGYTKETVSFQQKKEQNVEVKKFEFEGFRRTGRFGFKYYKSEVEINGAQVHAIIHKKKDQEVSFSREQIEEIKFPILPILRVWDIVCIILFLALMFVSYGMSIFAVFFFIKMTLVKNMQIRLKNNQKINIPIRQKAESVGFLREIGWSETIISKIEISAVSERRIIIQEWIVSGLMLALAAATVTVGMETYLENREINDAQTYEQEDVNNSEKELDEIDGTEESVPDEKQVDYASLYSDAMDTIVSEVAEGGGFIEYLTFAYYDIDKDGYLDFIMENGTSNADVRFEVYTTKDGQNVVYLGEVYGAISLYECPNKNGFYTDYGHTDYETVTYVYVEGNQLKQEIIHDNIYTMQYGYINGVAIEELKYPMEVHKIEELLFVGITGTYQCGSDEESGVIDIYIREDDKVDIRMGTHENPFMLAGTGMMLDKNTVIMEWNEGCVFTLKWSDTGVFSIQREGSCGVNAVDELTNNVEYVNASYYGVS